MADIEETFQQALTLHRAKLLDAAAPLYEAVLAQAPGHVGALQLMGALEGQRGRMEPSIALLQRAIAAHPADAFAYNNLGTALSLANRHEEALAAFDASVTLMPGNASALANRAKMLHILKRPIEALHSIDSALAIEPEAVGALIQRGEILTALSEFGMNRRKDAVATLRKALALGGDANSIRYALAALGALNADESAPTASPRQFVATLFDNYADSFDAHLVDVLKYQTPALIAALLPDLGPLTDADVLDLGCGTGLCGPDLRPLARRLVGVDLSANMLAHARQRQLYDELVCADIVDHLRTQESGVDLVVAADVFVYIGDLNEVFRAVQRALRPGGFFVFSIEVQAQADFVLHKARRFAHATAYIERLALQHGFTVKTLRPGVLREESGEAVNGCIAVLRRGD